MFLFLGMITVGHWFDKYVENIKRGAEKDRWREPRPASHDQSSQHSRLPRLSIKEWEEEEKEKKEIEEKEKPIWCRSPNNISTQEYGEFYKTLTSARKEYWAVKQFSIKGQRSLLFIPKMAPKKTC